MKNLDRLCFIIDGYPRTIPQAEALSAFMEEKSRRIDIVLNLEVPDDVLVERISKRLMCKCGASYHTISSPPKKDNICDLCGAEIFQREDDKAETVQNRLNVYKKQTQPLLDYYAKQDILVNIDGDKDVDGVFKEIRETLAKLA